MEVKNYLRRKLYEFRLTPKETAERSGVGVRFVREMLAGKPTLRMDKVNDVLRLFDATLGYENIPAARDEQDSSFADNATRTGFERRYFHRRR